MQFRYNLSKPIDKPKRLGYNVLNNREEIKMSTEISEWEKINAEQNRLAAERRAAAAAKDKLTAEQKRNRWLAEHNVPTTPPTRRNSWNDQPTEDR